MSFEDFQAVLKAMLIPLSIADQRAAYDKYMNSEVSVRESTR